MIENTLRKYHVDNFEGEEELKQLNKLIEDYCLIAIDGDGNEIPIPDDQCPLDYHPGYVHGITSLQRHLSFHVRKVIFFFHYFNFTFTLNWTLSYLLIEKETKNWFWNC